jgi:uncharacterized membrane protein YhaH (DUF805 family)
MDWLYLLTSFEGRISRQPFWIALLPLLALELIASWLMDDRWSSAISLLLAYPEFAVIAKRGHDRNVPTWLVGVFIAGTVLLDLLTIADLAGTPERPSTIVLTLGIPVALTALVLLIDFGCRRGTAGLNRYGPDPLEASRRANLS